MYLTGTYDRTLDAKGRLSLPPAFRKELGDRVRVIYAPEKDVDAVYVFDEGSFETWVDQVIASRGGYNPTNEEIRLVREWLNGEATTLDIDSASRISLPESDRRDAQLDHEVTVVGDGDHLVVWDRAKHAARRESVKKIVANFFDN